MNVITKNIELPDGRVISIETGKLAKQAHGSVVLTLGDTKILATAVSNYEAREGADFFPMSVDYQEKFASTGKIPGGFLKREGRLSDHEVLICRIVDRALRPLFPKGYHHETQIFIQLISQGDDTMPDALAALAASAALVVSDIPLAEPISEVRVAKINGEYKVNPTFTELESADLDLIVAATAENITMVEGEMNEASEEEMVEALKIAHDEIKKHCAVQKELEAAAGKTEKRPVAEKVENEELKALVKEKFSGAVLDVIKQHIANKAERSAKLDAILKAYTETLGEDSEIDLGELKSYFGGLKKDVIREYYLSTGNRLDGRALEEIRPIWSEINYLPSAHGSAVFTRGETQSLTSATLGTKLDQQMLDGAVKSGYNKFILHYNFPGFSTGEAKPNRGPGRREVGHGNLALRALKKVMPDDYPYTVRVVSDILESNGSSSMATVCAGALSMMDAGVPLKAPVSGIAMGLITDGDRVAVLSDILGDEDHLGDMDFKVTGTANGITACQMDIKIDGLPYEILIKALMQAKAGRMHILGEMAKTIDAPRTELKDNAPRIEVIRIKKDFIGALIGPGGKIIQEIQASTETTVTVEEQENDAEVQIFATNGTNLKAALTKINNIVAEPEEGEVYEGKIVSIQPYGAFVEFMPGKSGLLHVSEIMWERVEDPSKVLTLDEEIKVKLIGVDQKSGKFKLSRKVLLPKPEEA